MDQDLVSRFTIDAATDFLFGSDVQSLSAPLPYPHQTAGATHPNDLFSTAFLQAQIHLGRRSRYGMAWPLFEMFNKTHKTNMRVIKSFIEPIVNSAIDRAAQNDSSGDDRKPLEVLEGETLLDYMVKSTRGEDGDP